MIDIIKEKMDASEKAMGKALDHLRKEYGSVRAGRASAAVLDKIFVDYYGNSTPINQVASITTPEARILVISPWAKDLVKPICKAILASDIGITPIDDGSNIRLVFPQLTEDRRKELAKQVKKYGDEAKVTIRNERRDLIEKLKKLLKSSEITEDDEKDAEKQAQKLHDRFVAEVDKAIDEKNKEILTI